MCLLCCGFWFGQSTICFSHDQWADGSKVPDWIKSACCGPADAHLLAADQVHHYDGYWLVDGYKDKIYDRQELPSQDGHYWVFYRNNSNGSQSSVYCFFVPMEF